MATGPNSKPSFSSYRKWTMGLRVFFIVLLVLSVVVMVNYISHDFFLRLHLSTRTRNQLSPLTVKLLQSLTNRVRVVIYYNKNEGLYSTVSSLLDEYKLVNPKFSVETVDYLRDPGGAQKVKADYKLASAVDKNLVIFECDGKYWLWMAKLWPTGRSSRSQTRRNWSSATNPSPSRVRRCSLRPFWR